MNTWWCAFFITINCNINMAHGVIKEKSNFSFGALCENAKSHRSVPGTNCGWLISNSNKMNTCFNGIISWWRDIFFSFVCVGIFSKLSLKHIKASYNKFLLRRRSILLLWCCNWKRISKALVKKYTADGPHTNQLTQHNNKNRKKILLRIN